jgi:hypothetical protein
VAPRWGGGVVSIFLDEPATVPPAADISTHVAEVVEATRHLCDFRAGLAQSLETLAELAAGRMPDEGQRLLEPLLRILGVDKAADHAAGLYVAACRVIGGWDPDLDPDICARRLARLCRDAAHDIADEIHRDNRICCNATKEADR